MNLKRLKQKILVIMIITFSFMIFSLIISFADEKTELNDTNISIEQEEPKNVNTYEYNYSNLGASGKAIYYAAKAYGYKRQSLTSYEDVTNALNKGYMVIALVGHSKYAGSGYTHAIRLRGYNNGLTYVYDPDDSSNNGWNNLSYIWNHQSTDPYDRFEGAMFQSIYN